MANLKFCFELGLNIAASQKEGRHSILLGLTLELALIVVANENEGSLHFGRCNSGIAIRYGTGQP